MLKYHETVEALKEALTDVENGRVRPIEEAFGEIKKKHGKPTPGSSKSPPNAPQPGPKP